LKKFNDTDMTQIIREEKVKQLNLNQLL
jgi:hypothetical protein